MDCVKKLTKMDKNLSVIIKTIKKMVQVNYKLGKQLYKVIFSMIQ